VAGYKERNVSFIADIFKNVGNKHWDLARFGGVWAIASYSFAFLYSLLWLKQVPDWSDLGTGYGLVMTGVVTLIAGKDLARAKSEAPPPAAPPPAPPFQEPGPRG
jgi:predicted tellurium resistance membrane protein TerC